MNIFTLDYNVYDAAAAHCDKHIVKMPLEYAQLLFTACTINGMSHNGYRPTHIGHPCTIWAAASPRNWHWLYRLALAVGDEYTQRYKKVHASTLILDKLPHVDECEDAPTDWPQCVPDDCLSSDPVDAYRQYYLKHKVRFAQWNHSDPPDWWRVV